MFEEASVADIDSNVNVEDAASIVERTGFDVEEASVAKEGSAWRVLELTSVVEDVLSVVVEACSDMVEEEIPVVKDSNGVVSVLEGSSPVVEPMYSVEVVWDAVLPART